MNLYESVNKNLKETTHKELEMRKDALREKRRQALIKAGDKNIDDTISNLRNRVYGKDYKELEKEDREIACIDMLHSILTYGGSRDVEELVKDKYLQSYIDELGIDKVKELAAQEIEEYNNAEIIKDVHTDSEGVSYNSVHFKDDDVPIEIYQIQNTRDCPYAFMGWDYAKDKVNFRDDYELVSTISLPIQAIYIERLLDEVFEMGNLNKGAFNIIKPMRSISVSDIIKVGNKKYYVDSYGFEELPGEYKGKINEAEEEYHPNGVIDDIKRRGTGNNAVSSPMELNTGVLPIVNVDQYARQEDFYNMEDYMNDVEGDGSKILEPGDEDYFEIPRERIDEATMRYAPEVIEYFLQLVLSSAKVKATGMYHPDYYNFKQDELEFTVDFDEKAYQELEDSVVKDPEFAKYLKDNYSSYDGFFSYMANNLDDFYKQDGWKRFVSVINFCLKDDREEMDMEEDTMWEKIRQDLY